MHKTILILLSVVIGCGSQAAAREKTVVSGSTGAKEMPMIGSFYDFKQTQKHEPTGMDRPKFDQIVAKFVNNDWVDDLLKDYYRVPRALYATEIFIDTINSDVGPKAFGADKSVDPRMWMVHFKAQVEPPSDGTYRFIGNADDFLGVAVNGQTVLFAVRTEPHVKWSPKETCKDRNFTAGDWFEAKVGKPIDLDIVAGDSPGGQFRCLLGIEKKGEETAGRPIPFQVARSEKSSRGGTPWKCLQ